MKHEVIVIILIMVFVSSWITEVIGVHAIFGAFLLGVVTPRLNGFALRLTERIEVGGMHPFLAGPPLITSI